MRRRSCADFSCGIDFSFVKTRHKTAGMALSSASISNLQLAEAESRRLVARLGAKVDRTRAFAASCAAEEEMYVDAVSDDNTPDHNSQLVERVLAASERREETLARLYSLEDELMVAECWLEFECLCTDHANVFALDDENERPAL